MSIHIEQIIAYIIPVVMWALIVAITLRQFLKKQPASTMLAWLMIIYLVPIFGILIYLILGEINLGKRRVNLFKQIHPKYMQWFAELSQQHYLVNHQNATFSAPLFELAQRRLGIPCVQGNELHILDNPQAIMHSIIQDIQQAKQSINMLFYIWSNGGMVEEVMKALIDARQRGVQVRILLDYVGSRPFFKSKEYREMREHGIEIAEAIQVNLLRMFFSRIDLRQHRKIIVIDNQIAYTGSMNMVDPRYFKQDSNVGEWVDIMVRINGAVATVLNTLQAQDWQMETGEQIPTPFPQLSENSHLPLDSNAHAVQILATGPGFPDDLVEQSLATAIFAARQRISITSPYFVPSQNIAEALRTAALRGVEVSLIVPHKNDSLMVRWASRNFFDDLLQAGVKIYLFDQGLLHTKSILIDNRLALVGTVNMDMRSFLLNFEVTMAVEDMSFAHEINQLHANYMQSSSLLDKTEWEKRPIYCRIIERLFFIFSPLL